MAQAGGNRLSAEEEYCLRHLGNGYRLNDNFTQRTTDILAQISTITMNLRGNPSPGIPKSNSGSLRGPYLTCMEVNSELNNTMVLEKRMLSIKELSDYLGVSPQTIYNRLSAGTFPIKTKRIGRRLKWDRRDVDHYLDKLPTINLPTTI